MRIFSRRLEDITHEYPDVVGYVMEAMESRDFVVEGEIVTVDPDTGEIKPFQELMHRKRKHDIKEAVEEYPPVEVFLFDAIYMDGVDLTDLPLIDRKRALWGAMKPHPKVHHATWRLLDDPAETDKFFLEAISNDCEGIMCKSVKRDSIYELGARGWLWIKYKRDYKSELTDTLDLAVVGGAFWGAGGGAGLDCMGGHCCWRRMTRTRISSTPWPRWEAASRMRTSRNCLRCWINTSYPPTSIPGSCLRWSPTSGSCPGWL